MVKKHKDTDVAEVDVFMKDGRYQFNFHVMVGDLRSFWRRRKDQIRWICFNVGMDMYFWSEEKGWQVTKLYERKRKNYLADNGIYIF